MQPPRLHRQQRNGREMGGGDEERLKAKESRLRKFVYNGERKKMKKDLEKEGGARSSFTRCYIVTIVTFACYGERKKMIEER